MMLHRIIFTAAVPLLIAGAVAAQQTPQSTLLPGTRVRVFAPRDPLIGGVQTVRGDTLFLTAWEQPLTVTIPMITVRRLEISRGRESRWSSAGRWAWRSGLVWAGLMGLAVSSCREEDGCNTDFAGVLVVQGAITGAMVGATYGAFAPRERWMTHPLPGR